MVQEFINETKGLANAVYKTLVLEITKD